MELFIVDAFTNELFGGNQAGVVLLGENEPFPEDRFMQNIASELKHSETVFVKASDSKTYRMKYFTPEGEVALCGHATVSAFTVLRNEKGLAPGAYFADTLAGNLNVRLEKELVWLETAKGRMIRQLNERECAELYGAYGLGLSDCPPDLRPCIVTTGLPDILLPVNDKTTLESAVQNRDEIVRISKRLSVVGVHMFYYAASLQATAYCRNFAPLYGIDEESATGTSNASLTYYLHQNGLVEAEQRNVFVQGERMGKPSVIFSRIASDGTVSIGGNAVVSIKGCFNF